MILKQQRNCLLNLCVFERSVVSDLTPKYDQASIERLMQRIYAGEEVGPRILNPDSPPYLMNSHKRYVVTYAFLMLADAVALKSLEVLGKEFTTEEIQTFFVGKAIKELREEKKL
jgi:hypothetical protein